MLGSYITSMSNSKRRSARAKDKASGAKEDIQKKRRKGRKEKKFKNQASGAKEEIVSAHKRMPWLGKLTMKRHAWRRTAQPTLKTQGGGGGLGGH